MRARSAIASLLLLLTGACGLLGGAIGDRAQIQDWGKTVDGTGERYGRDVATNDRGTVFLVGAFNATAVFGAGERTEVTLSATGGWNSYLAAYEENGDFEWATSIEGQDVFVQAVAADDQRRVAVVGYTSGYAVFRFPFGITRTVEPPPGASEAGFLAVYDVDGTLSWVEPYVSDQIIEALDVDFGQDGDLLVGGTWSGTAILNGTENFIPTSAGFLLGYTGGGTPISEVEVVAVDAGYATIWSVARFDNGDGLIAGDFAGTVSIVDGTQLTSDSGSQDMFCARVSYFTGTAWAHRLGGPGEDTAFAVDVNSRDMAALVGEFTQPGTNFPGGTFEHRGLRDAFVMEFGEDGGVFWSHSIGGSGVDTAYAVGLDKDGSVVVAGQYNSELLHVGIGDRGEEVTLAAPPGTESDAFVSYYSSYGVLDAVYALTGLGVEYGMGAVISKGDALVISGAITAETAVRDAAGRDIRIIPVTGDRTAFLAHINLPHVAIQASAP